MKLQSQWSKLDGYGAAAMASANLQVQFRCDLRKGHMLTSRAA